MPLEVSALTAKKVGQPKTGTYTQSTSIIHIGITTSKEAAVTADIVAENIADDDTSLGSVQTAKSVMVSDLPQELQDSLASLNDYLLSL